MNARSIGRAVLAGLFVALAIASPAFADPAGPTDYRSEITSIDPPTPTIHMSVLGGDSFIQLVVDPGTEVTVVGYRGEPYLRFTADGTVLENRNSPTTYTNASRYGGGEIPANATPDADPDWKQVASGGQWVWHDHRSHWMQRSRPFGKAPGDQIVEAVIPLTVDGAPVKVTVISTWLPEPSPAPVWLGAVAGVVLAAGVWLARGRRVPAVAVAAPAVLAALVAGVWEYLSLPAETGPRPLWWALPTIAAICAVVGVVAELRQKRFVADAALFVVGCELAMWGFFKRDGRTAAIIPTNAPDWFDRFATALAFTSGVAMAAIASWWLFRKPAAAADATPAPTGGQPAVTGSTAP